ncbi:hypothetical protein GCM10023322_38310 [Rugosimonospora acidiphila]|uniref:Excreted virulence factor EspC, type VII ESX diderm n=1 Tax=Rugosimonospora acidiphila TaxID=556531 RepID=A0ABP9RVV9_9ACTN
MSFRVEPQALRTYAGQLDDAWRDADAARTYVNRWGTLNAHEKGILGMIFPQHANFVSQLNTMLKHLAELADASSTVLSKEADDYEHTDLKTAAMIDASYPATPRAPINRS